MSDTGNTADGTGRGPLTEPATARAYLAVFTEVMDGFNRPAAQALGDLTPEQLAELHVICGDVRILVVAEQQRRGGANVTAIERFAEACRRVDSDPRAGQRISDIVDMVAAEDIIYAEAVAASARGDKDAALKLLRWCAPLGIGDSPRLLANALEDMGKLAEARVWYARAARDNDVPDGSQGGGGEK